MNTTNNKQIHFETFFVVTRLIKFSVSVTAPIPTFIGYVELTNNRSHSLNEENAHSYANWLPGYPIKSESELHCVIMHSMGFWENVSCDMNYLFMCKKIRFVRQ